MDTGRGQIDLFLHRCDEVMRSRFIIADTKIGELLKAIASSDLLYAFFRDITKDFDYVAAQKKYLDYAPYGSSRGRKLLFPEDPQEKLAFIFCLLVEFDSKKRDLSAFLQEYFYEDGSVYESFYAFTNQVIKPFRNAVKVMFRDGMPQIEKRGEKSPLKNFSDVIWAEREEIYASSLPDAEKVEAMLILNALGRAEDMEMRAGLLCGYAAFMRATGWKSMQAEILMETLETLKEDL